MIKRWIRNWLLKEEDNRDKVEDAMGAIVGHNSSKPRYPNAIKGSSGRREYSFENGLNFTVFPANGGKVIEFKHYDSVTETMTSSLHIVPENEEFSDSVAKIVTYECLRNGK